MTFVPNINIQTNIVPGGAQANPAKTTLIFGHRSTAVNGVDGVFIQTTPGLPQVEPYKPFYLGSFPSGNSALNYMSQLGFRVAYNPEFTLAMGIPTSVSSTNVITNTQILNYAGSNALVTKLLNVSFAGSIVEATTGTTGTVLNISLNQTDGSLQVLVLLSKTTSFLGTNATTLQGFNENGLPDPANTDEICMNVYNYFQAQTGLNASGLGNPSAYISVLSQSDVSVTPYTNTRDTTHSPNAASFTLAGYVNSTPNGDGTTTLNFLTQSETGGYLLTEGSSPFVLEDGETGILLENNDDELGATVDTVNGFGWMPLTALGQTKVTVGAVSGIFISTTFVNNASTTFQVLVQNIGTVPFPSTGAVTVTLDSSQSGFQYLQNIQLSYATAAYDLNALSQVLVGGNCYDFVTAINLMNSGNYAQDGKFLVQGIFGNVTVNAMAAQTLFNVIGNQYFKTVSYPYKPQFLDPVFNGVNLACALAYAEANKDSPYYPLDSVVLSSLPVASSVSNRYNTNIGMNADTALSLGWIPIGVNGNGNAFIVRDVTTLIKDPGTGVTDTEFRYQHVWDVTRFMIENIYQAFAIARQAPGTNNGFALNSPYFDQSFANTVKGLLTLWGNPQYQLLQNVSEYLSLVTVTTDASDPTKVDVFVPAQVIPGLSGANISINLFSVYATFNQGQ